MTISTTQAVPLQAASVSRRVFSPVEITRRAGQKSYLMCTICGNFAALMANIFGFFRPCFAIGISSPIRPDLALAKRIIAFFARNAGSRSYK
jgi:hypothetical protein